MTLTTRRPTGLPSWPIILLAGAEKAGKSWACAAASASDLIGRTLWLPIGEDDPDEYGTIPGADFEIIQHDGSLRGIVTAAREAAAEPAGDRPTLLVVDSITRLWNLLTDRAQATANQRAAKKNRLKDGEDAQITMDLWNQAKDGWEACMRAIRAHKGPVLLTARLEQVAVMSPSGQPTTAKEWKVQGHKSLPFDVGAVVQMPQRGTTIVSGVRSTRLQLSEPTPIKNFTVDEFWRRLGLADGPVSAREHSDVTTADPMSEKSRAHLFALFGSKGVGERERQLKAINYYTGATYESRGALSEADAQKVIAGLSRMPDAPVEASSEPVDVSDAEVVEDEG